MRSERSHFLKMAEEAGFRTEQAEFLWEHLAKFPHTHTSDQIEDLDQAVEDILAEHLPEELLDEREE